MRRSRAAMSDFALIRNVEKLAARFAMHGIAVMREQAAIRTAELDLIRAQDYLNQA